MPVLTTHYKNVLKFWRAVETFSLPDVPAWRRSDGKVYNKLEPVSSKLPWEPGNLPAPREGKQWKHTLYFHVVTKETVADLLARLSGSTEFREPVPGITCLAALTLNHLGEPTERTYSPAAFIYGIKLLREKHDPEELDALLRKAQEDYLERFHLTKEQQAEKEERPEMHIVNWAALQNELSHLRALTRKELLPQTSILCISEMVAAATTPEAPFLNSYYMQDLNTLINEPGDPGQPMKIYLQEQVDMKTRYNLLDQHALLDKLHPKHQSAGRWPSDPAFGLYSAQQSALHLMLPGLRQGSGLLGVNGPPGTGKTTLLREVVADVVVTRARRLLNANVSELFSNKRIPIIGMLGYYPIDSTIFGNDGIVVSGNNNTAIENISKELPLLKSIDRETFGDAEYFSGTASNIQGEPCWGMLSAVLGKSENRGAFVNKFWFNSGHGFGKFLKEQYEDPIQAKKNAENYAETAGELTALLGEYDRFHRVACEHHDLLYQILVDGRDGAKQQEQLEILAATLTGDYGIFPDDLPDLGFLDLPVAVIHKLTPYSSKGINRLRSEIYLRSLELHEWAIRVNARFFNSNLTAFINMVSNKQADSFTPEITAVLWSSFFFCIPVVSVTLASFQRQFTKMGQGCIGWLLLDEAGQATPSAACGAIWRSQRSIIIGDTMQIPPVVTIPKGLGKLLQDTYGIKDDNWSPLNHSAQFLADRVTAAGTYITAGDNSQVWTGIPLRAHRRCSEPMFSISNEIAYNRQMVKVRQDVQSDIPTGSSGWIDVSGVTPLDGHAIQEELDVLEDLLIKLGRYTGKIFVISPFRSVAEICRANFYEKDRIECGTIHTFQGKEAEIVFLVLGTLPGNVSARNWVAESPNILNVAVTRAKERLYVIGNRRVWAGHKYFGYLAEKLPVKEHFSGRLF